MHSFFAFIIPYLILTIGRLEYKTVLFNKKQQQQQKGGNTKTGTSKSSNIKYSEYEFLKAILFGNRKSIFILISYSAYLISTYYSLRETWMDGYHSPRQIFYGLILSFFSLYQILLITSIYNKLELKSSFRNLTIYITLYILIATTMIYLYFGYLPVTTGGLILSILGYSYLVYFTVFVAKDLYTVQKLTTTSKNNKIKTN
ncbi:hypothetical protein DLAC_08441 [Tieghemostelium lacteum]|uniref:Uncharacterized protein n=1 Tax=Tieghemostelium lacteum TaxID=361077 RepID=A0A151ZC69_TIELA|nr:hypothetical protein DLAC_08441 [Tieghemostelium lacteum]|eukprot:KYQ91474.1 hypothetical protein DLAC_08441 [Tieghemostelium lacteum]